MTAEQIEKYIREDLGCEPRHDCEALSCAIEDMVEELEYDVDDSSWNGAYDLMRLLLSNVPIPELYTHSYTFHTGQGRYIIETLKEKYYEYKGTS